MDLRNEAAVIIQKALVAALPAQSMTRALSVFRPGSGKLIVICAGKAAWSMALAAENVLAGKITKGIVVTKYGHVKRPLKYFACYEAGHPKPDRNTYEAAEKVLSAIRGCEEGDQVLLLLSGGASALFELPMISHEACEDLADRLLKSGADITEINTVRKHLSCVKGGRFAYAAAPADVYVYALSDVLGDDLSVIGSGPAVPDPTTAKDVYRVLGKYDIGVTEEMENALRTETPKSLNNVVHTEIIGNVRRFAEAAKEVCEEMGYKTEILTDCLNAEAREAGRVLGTIARYHASGNESRAFIMGGETVVHVRGTGKGGRNQELALSAAEEIRGLDNVTVFSIGSDGTDGPTDAAGGLSDGKSAERLEALGLTVFDVLQNNDAYHALAQLKDLIVTGPTGTNVNDISVALIRK